MDWPSEPLESQRRFAPRFCPRRSCPEHRRTRGSFAYARSGSYRGHLGRKIRRYRCSSCGKTFSTQSFACSYYLKRPELVPWIAAGLAAGSAHRQIARTLGCAPSTVTRLAARLGRHALLLQARALVSLPPIDETVVIDHFETFEFSQDLPFGVATATGADSWFTYALDPAPHARSGSRSPAQQRRLERRPRRDMKGGYLASFQRVLGILEPLAPAQGALHIATDGHPDYRASGRTGHSLVHHILPNPVRGPKGSPRSPEAIERDQAMFANDLLHLLLRHSLAHQHRETIAFGRRINALMERFFVFLAWRNFIKRRSERKPAPVTPAMVLKLTSSPWSWRRLFARRLFPDRERVPETWRELYRREWVTPVLRSNTRHRLCRAF